MLADALRGIYPALTTPLDTEGRPDLRALSEIVEMNLEAGVAGLVPMGGTGEFTALSNQDRIAVVERVAQVAKGRAAVLAGIVAPGLSDAIELGQAYRALGVDATMLITPFYVTPTQQGVQAYFRSYKAAVGGAVVYYDMPMRTRFAAEIDTFAALADDGTIIGAKICNTDLHYFNQLSARLGEQISLLSGDDTLYVTHMLHGGRGGILASAPLLPRFYIDLQAQIESGDIQGAIARHRSLFPIFAALFNETNPGPLKAMMARFGYGSPDVALPLQATGAPTNALIDAAVALINAQGWR